MQTDTPKQGIAWEGEGEFSTRLWDTVSNGTIDPVNAFRGLRPDGSNGKALSLSMLTALFGNWPYLLCAPCLGLIPFMLLSYLSSTPLGHDIPDWVRNMGLGAALGIAISFPIVIFLFSVSVDLLHGVVFFTLGRLFGGHGDLATSMRAGLYTGLIRFWLWPVLLVAFVPMVGTILQILGRLALVVWSGFALYGAALRVHGLEERRAAAVGVLTPLIALSVFAAFWGGGGLIVWALIAGGLHSLPNFPN